MQANILSEFAPKSSLVLPQAGFSARSTNLHATVCSLGVTTAKALTSLPKTQQIQESFRNLLEMLQHKIHQGKMVQIFGLQRAIVVSSCEPVPDKGY